MTLSGQTNRPSISDNGCQKRGGALTSLSIYCQSVGECWKSESLRTLCSRCYLSPVSRIQGMLLRKATGMTKRNLIIYQNGESDYIPKRVSARKDRCEVFPLRMRCNLLMMQRREGSKLLSLSFKDPALGANCR